MKLCLAIAAEQIKSRIITKFRCEFGIRKGTIFEDNQLKLTNWFLAFYLEKEKQHFNIEPIIEKYIDLENAQLYTLIYKVKGGKFTRINRTSKHNYFYNFVIPGQFCGYIYPAICTRRSMLVELGSSS